MHDEGVIDGKTDHLIDTKRAERFGVCFEPRQMIVRASRSEGTRHTKKDDALSSENILSRQLLPLERVWATQGIIANARVKDCVRNGLGMHVWPFQKVPATIYEELQDRSAFKQVDEH